MSFLRLFFFGPPQIERDGMTIELASRKAIALLAFLAVPAAARSYSRETLSTLLWPEYDQQQARAYIRHTLWLLKKTLGEAWFESRQERVRLNHAAQLWLDVAEFRKRLSATTTHGHSAKEVCSDCLVPLTEAVALYQDDFLAGFTLRDCPEFDEWQFLQTESLRRELAGALERLIRGYSAQGNFDAALPYARRWLSLDPLHEPAHRHLMQLYARTGQQLAALRQYQDCVRLLQTELGVLPSDETSALYEAIKARYLLPPAKPEATPSVPLSEDARPSLPPQSTSFIGRQEELADISRLIREEAGCRLLTLLGPGGIGKTRLSIEAASVQLNTFADGVAFVPLAPVNPADFAEGIDPLVATMADALKIAFHAKTTPTRQLLDYLGQKEMLIVLDNFEHLLESVEVVAAILGHAAQVKLLVTSRERLNLPEEWLYLLEGLAVPIDTSPPIGGTKRRYSALQLFEQRARQVKPRFDLATEQAGVIRICRLVEGLPLGIELAAAWVRLMSCQAIAAEIEKNIDFLSTSMRMVPDRHRSLRAVFDHSWRRLSTMEQTVLGRLSVFQGGFQSEAAVAVAGASLPLLATLVDKSMLQVSPSGRYDLHELLKQFAAEKFQQSVEDYEAIHDRHCNHFAAFLQQQETQLKGAGLKTGLVAILRDLDNVRLAWRWAVEHNRQTEIEQSMESLLHFYEIQGWFLEGEEVFRRAATMLEVQCALQETSSGRTVMPESCLLYGRVLYRQTWFRNRLGLYERLEEQFQKSLWLLRRADDRMRQELAVCLLAFGMSFIHRREGAKAVSLLQESLTIYKEIGDLWGGGVALLCLGQAVVTLGQFEEAERLSQESVVLLSQIGERRYIIHAMSTLGRLAALQGNYPQAERWHQECLEWRIELDDRVGIAYTLNDLADTARRQGRSDQARQYYQQSLTLAKEIGLRQVQNQVLWELGSLAEKQGHYAEAKRFFQESLAAYEGRYITVNNPAGPGWAHLGLGELQEATTYFRNALHSALQNQAATLALDALTGIAYLLAQAGKPEQALELLGLVQYHPASTQETKDRAAKLHDKLISELPPEAVAAARVWEKQRTLEAVAAEILAGET